MRVFVPCEESQAVCIAFRNKGHEAFSCDILPCSGEHPEWHIQGDCLEHIFDGWDLMIAFPPCTHLACSGAKHFAKKIADGRQQEAVDFFMKFVYAPIPKICIENPIGIMSTKYRKPNQIIQPYEYGHTARKSTCLWTFNLPSLKPTKIVEPDIYTCKNGKTFSRDYMVALRAGEKRGQIRSKTYQGIADAMAEQWGGLK